MRKRSRQRLPRKSVKTARPSKNAHLVGPAGGEQTLCAALEYAKRKGWLVPNRETGAVTRQKRFAGTDRKSRFVYFREAFLGAAAQKVR
jgi:hypothetical protein